MTNTLSWVHSHHAAMWWMGGLSLLTLVGSLIVVPILVVGLPPDYFTKKRRAENQPRFRHPLLHLTMVVGKNLLGALLILAGLFMFLIPGQGMLTMLIGVTLVDFPGKYRFERRMVRIPVVLRSINWLRTRYGRTELHCL